ncbi:hypothetical protein SGA02_21880 [Staphylococcus gallinarum]|jgi:hypothetical protein|uniref:Uncharacterized protein n=1 Tax=Staphylococcus gallinarum TaxID=1293 RepID=A0A380FCY1_STAGA|nr:hypothetical protein SGA02_21880 [Staphylococcus gallinarum]SUM31084.1 Uncharacterised protein [Staphylococcus gallinarum]
MGLLFVSILRIVIARLPKGWVEPRPRHVSYSLRCLANNTQFLYVITTKNKTHNNELIDAEIIHEIKQEMNNELSDEDFNKITNYRFYYRLKG